MTVVAILALVVTRMLAATMIIVVAEVVPVVLTVREAVAISNFDVVAMIVPVN